MASKEIIISAGAIDSAKLLLLSGVGPAKDLQALGIEVKANLPVGKNLIDHPCVPLTYHMGHGFTRRLELSHDSYAMKNAIQEFENGKGPLAQHYSTTPTAYLRSQTVLESDEFKTLSTSGQMLLKKPTVPSFEFAIVLYIPKLFFLIWQTLINNREARSFRPAISSKIAGIHSSTSSSQR
jgi:choline dehydrogenase-like flavoprotein